MKYEQWVAARLSKERKERDWSLEKVSQEMSKVGCPIPSTAIHKIEKSDPPRKISLNEFFAFAQIFGLTPEQMAEPPEPLEDEVRQLAREIQEAREEAVPPLARWLTLVEKFQSLHPSTPVASDLLDLVVTTKEGTRLFEVKQARLNS